MLSLWFALVGCSATWEIAPGWSSTIFDSGTDVCTTTLVSAQPMGEGVNRHRVVTVELTPDRLSGPFEVELEVEMDTVQGPVSVPGSVLLFDGPFVQLRFVPDQPFAPLTRHVVRTFTPSCGLLHSHEFVTNEIGLPVLDPTEAIGVTFVGNLANASFNRPPTGHPLLGPTGAVEFVITDLDPKAERIVLQVQRQSLDPYKQAETPPVTLIGRWTNPSFAVFGAEFPLYIGDGIPVELAFPSLSGDLSPDRRQLAGLAVEGVLDLRTVSFGDATTSELCTAVAAEGVCEPCEDGTTACTSTVFRDWNALRLAP